MKLRAVLFVAACGAFVSQAAAQDAVRVAFANGRVTIIADNATVPEILREWARAGGSSFINAEKIVPTERLTLRLENEHELRAIDVLLRPFAGYAVVARPAGSTAASAVGRVVIMPSARPAGYPVAAAAAPPAAAPSFADFNKARTINAQTRPDDDGAVQQVTPPPASAVPQPSSATPPGAPIGQANPLGSTPLQTGPVSGTTTSSRPGVVIGAQPVQPRPGGRADVAPMQPKPAGGGG